MPEEPDGTPIEASGPPEAPVQPRVLVFFDYA